MAKNQEMPRKLARINSFGHGYHSCAVMSQKRYHELPPNFSKALDWFEGSCGGAVCGLPFSIYLPH